jgi:exodeoxyribonuclease VII large subunit
MADRLSLSELQLIIKDSLYLAMPDSYWVVAEISEMKVNSAGHCYLELIEKHPDENDIKARVKGIVWSNRYRFLKALFESSTGESLGEGLKILIRVKVDYHELYGLSLQIQDIDPSFTLGEMALKRQMIIKKLEEEGVFSMNRELDFPAVPQKIAVISSKNAAGYQDFINHLKNNSSGYVFYSALFDTVMQGTDTEQSVIGSLDRIAGFPELFDVVVIIRGGGSQTDLSWFDNYNIAYHITQFPIPVLTGIGHEKDLSVADLVAYKSVKTPTAVADYLIEYAVNADMRLKEISTGIIENSLLAIDEFRKQVDSFRSNLVPFARLHLSYQKENLSGTLLSLLNVVKEKTGIAAIFQENRRARLVSATRSFSDNKTKNMERLFHELMNFTRKMLKNMKLKIEGFRSSLQNLDPEMVLKRGYTITTYEGKMLKSSRNIPDESIIETRLSDGRIKSRVIKKKEINHNTARMHDLR